MRVVATVDGQSYDHFTLEQGQIVAMDSAGKVPVSPAAEWRLAGDMKFQWDRFLFSPEYEIVVRSPVEGAPVSAPLRCAIIRPRVDACWARSELAGGILVFVWFVDGKPVIVKPSLARKQSGPAGDFAGLAAIELNEDTVGGAPAVLLLRNDRFVAPKPMFSDPGANRTLAAIHLGDGEGMQLAFDTIKNIDGGAHVRGAKDARSAMDVFYNSTRHISGDVAEGFVGGGMQWPKSGATLLHFAAEGGFDHAVRLLLNRGASPNATDDTGWRPLHAAAVNGREGVVDLLLGADANRVSKNEDGLAPGQQAAENGHCTVALSLLTKPSNAELKTLLQQAVAQGEGKAVQELAELGADRYIRKMRSTALVRSFQLGKPELTRALLDGGMNGDKVVDGSPLIVIAGGIGEAGSVQALLESGVDPGKTTRKGVSALMMAAMSGSVPTVGVLTDGGADANLRDLQGNTALHYAVLFGHANVASALLQGGASPTVKDDKGRTPLEVALEMHSRGSVDALVAAGSRLDVQSSDFQENLERAIAVDSVALLKWTAEDGWDPAVATGGLPALRLAELYRADETIDWLNTLDANDYSDLYPITAGDSPAAWNGGDRPIDVRVADISCESTSVKIEGIISPDGKFTYPRITSTADDRLSYAVLSAAPTWTFRPAETLGRPVNSRIALDVPFPGHDRGVQAAESLDSRPLLLNAKRAGTDFRTVEDLKYESIAGQGLGMTGGTIGSVATSSIEPVGTMYSEPLRDHWAAVTLIVEPDRTTSAIQVLDAVSPNYAKAVENVLETAEFEPGRSGDKFVRSRLTLVFPQPDVTTADAQ